MQAELCITAAEGGGSPDLLVPTVWDRSWAEFTGLCSACSHEGPAQHSTEILSLSLSALNHTLCAGMLKKNF